MDVKVFFEKFKDMFSDDIKDFLHKREVNHTHSLNS
jgi:hypothetical protein